MKHRLSIGFAIAGLCIATSNAVLAGPSVNVTQHHNNPSRDGLYIDPAFTPAAAATLVRDLSFNGTIVGNVYSQPLYVEGGPSGPVVIVATESNNVYALKISDGMPLWQRNVGTAISSGLPCGNISPVGITGTPVVDLASRSLFLDAEVSGSGHQIFSLNVDTGAINAGWPVTLNTAVSGFDSSVQSERGALGIVGNILYVPYGGRFGDCGSYRGRLVGVQMNNPATVASWATGTTRAGVWAPGGVASDGTNTYVTTGNGSGATWAGNEAVIRLQPGPVFSGSTTDFWAPTNWMTLDSGDADLSGSGPIIVDVPGATPSALVVAIGKDRNAYLLNRTNLGGVSVPLAQANVSTGTVIGAPATYRTSAGTFVVHRPVSGTLLAFRITATSPPTIATGWSVASSGRTAPFVTSTDGTNNTIVWAAGSDGRLRGYNGDTGATVYTGGSTNELMTGTRSFSTGIAARGRIYYAADNRVYAFSVLTGPTPTPGPTGTPTATPTASATPSATPVPTPSPTPVVTPTATPIVTPSPTPVVTPTATPVATPSPTPVITPTATPIVTPSSTPVVSPTSTPPTTPTPPVSTPTATPVITPTTTPGVTPTPGSNTPPGSNVTVGSSSGDESVTFGQVTAAGVTTFTLIDPASAGQLPAGYQLTAASRAFDITTTAVIVPPIDVIFDFPTVNDSTLFASLRILHNENGTLVNRTAEHDFAARTIRARVNSLSPFVVVQVAAPAQPLNLSTRMRVQTGDNVGIGGFIVTGGAPKHILLRAIGPSLASSVPDALADTLLELHGPTGFVTIANDNWRDDPDQTAAIKATGIPPTNNLEAAIDTTLNPGAYTAIISGKNNSSGAGLIEVYDLSQAVPAKLANISTRAAVDVGNNVVIAGFILGGSGGGDRVVLRGIGPSLSAGGVANALADPKLELRDGSGALLMANDNWQDDSTQAAELIAAGLAPTGSLEAAIAATLPPGLYSALLAGVNNSTGVGLVEVYDRGAP